MSRGTSKHAKTENAPSWDTVLRIVSEVPVPRAHTLASENGDVYRAWEAGYWRALLDVKRAIQHAMESAANGREG